MRLRQAPAGATPRLQLAHPTGTGVFRLHPITTPRPADGTVDTVIACGTCEVAVPLRLSSAGWVRAQRRRRLVTGGLVVLCQVGIGILLIVSDLRQDWDGLLFLLGFLLIMSTPFTAGPPLRESREEDGVASLDPGHPLREPGHTYDYVDSDGGNFEAGL